MAKSVSGKGHRLQMNNCTYMYIVAGLLNLIQYYHGKFNVFKATSEKNSSPYGKFAKKIKKVNKPQQLVYKSHKDGYKDYNEY